MLFILACSELECLHYGTGTKADSSVSADTALVYASHETSPHTKSDRPAIAAQSYGYGKKDSSNRQSGPESRLIKEMVRNKRAH